MMIRLLTALLTLSTASAFELRPGQPFPEILLPTVRAGKAEAGALMSLQDFRGQKLMLHVFASW